MTLHMKQPKAVLALSAVVFVGMAALAWAGDAKPAKKAAPAAAATAAAPAVQNPLAKAMVGAGATTCGARIDQIANFVGSGENPAGVLFLPQSDSNGHLVSASVELTTPEKTAAYTSMTFSPTKQNGCDAGYEAIVWWPKKCDDVAKTQFEGKQIVGKMKQEIIVINIDTFARAFLMPTKDGCIAIKKEVVF